MINLNFVKNKGSRIISFVILIGFSLRIFELGRTDLWFDEVSMFYVAKFITPASIKSISIYFTLPLLFTGIVRVWSFISTDEFFLRFISVIFGTFSILGIYQLCKKLFKDQLNNNAAIISAALLAISPFHIHYSREFTPYSMFTFFAIYSSYFLLNSLESGLWKYWSLYIITSFLCINLHWFGILLVLGQAIWCMFFRTNTQLKRFILSLSIISISCLPLFISGIMHMFYGFKSDVMYWIRPGLSNPLLNILILFNIFNIGFNLNMFLFIVAFLAFTLFFLLGIINFRKNPKSTSFLIIWLFFPVILVLVGSIFIPVFLHRYFIFCLPAYLILLALGIAECKMRNFVVIIILFIMLATTFISLKNYYNDVYPLPESMFRPGVHENKDYKRAAFYIKDNYLKGDLIAHSSLSTYDSIPFYQNCYKSRFSLDYLGVLLDLSPFKGSHYSDISWIIEDYKNLDLKGSALLKKYLRYDVKDIASSYRRVWFILSDWEPVIFDESCLELKKWLFRNFKLIENKSFNGIDVYLFDTGEST